MRMNITNHFEKNPNTFGMFISPPSDEEDSFSQSQYEQDTLSLFDFDKDSVSESLSINTLLQSHIHTSLPFEMNNNIFSFEQTILPFGHTTQSSPSSPFAQTTFELKSAPFEEAASFTQKTEPFVHISSPIRKNKVINVKNKATNVKNNNKNPNPTNITTHELESLNKVPEMDGMGGIPGMDEMFSFFFNRGLNIPTHAENIICNSLKEKLIGNICWNLKQEIVRGRNTLVSTHDIFDIIENKNIGNFIKFLAEGVKYNERTRSGFGIRLYQYRYHNKLLHIVVPIFSGTSNPKFAQLDSLSEKAINDMMEKRAPNMTENIINIIITNLLYKTKSFEYFVNYQDAVKYIHCIGKFWKIHFKFINTNLNSNLNSFSSDSPVFYESNNNVNGKKKNNKKKSLYI